MFELHGVLYLFWVIISREICQILEIAQKGHFWVCRPGNPNLPTIYGKSWLQIYYLLTMIKSKIKKYIINVLKYNIK